MLGIDIKSPEEELKDYEPVSKYTKSTKKNKTKNIYPCEINSSFGFKNKGPDGYLLIQEPYNPFPNEDIILNAPVCKS